MLKTTRQFAVLAASVSALMLAPYAHAQDADKTAAIKELLTVMQADQVVKNQGEMFQQNAKQDAPAVLEQVLIENKTLNDKQKQAVVDKLKKNGAVQRMVDGAGQAFTTDAFKKDAIQAHYEAFGKYYSTQELKDLTTFLKSSTGQKFMTNQGKATQEIWGSTMQKYGPQVGKAMRDAAEKEIAAAAK
ncbi:hypothetical protein BKK79_05815 [Cupriavidus sp. USMAA2-4]|uniref:DUF2059 domain-containing protein n=1 Tax=Cupriavidus malaysiensis TaxID=367825 RepID=A0ABM6F239_9BURK|nr:MULTISPECIES: DUF2059 domain-containing protein [Cupriavidus]AOY91391.1 hypothetical protein BKK79_05815 [Cupriavidus sp. USMAA2-4]AOY99040.1 hypothetical protein BKK81_07040 [Cupriavidus sp. USMAHM13]AOZ05462.1 hypothetical protein BKK80_06340 [Cupriavidus malaysiensis]